MADGAGFPPALPPVAEVEAIRAELVDGGYKPVEIINWNADHKDRGKAPIRDGWQHGPELGQTDLRALNTGILCTGLRAIDVDIDNPTLAHTVRRLAMEMLGEAPMRYRDNSPRVLFLFRAAEGEPPKRSAVAMLGKVEVLGRGQQFVAYGVHHSGATLRWMPEGPREWTADALPVVTEEQITGFLEEAGKIIGAAKPASNAGNREPSPLGQRGPVFDVVAALAAIPNDGPVDWEAWNRVGMVLWGATNGSEIGRAAWHEWSARHPAYDEAATEARWQHYRTSPPGGGAGTLFAMAGEQGWRRETTREVAGRHAREEQEHSAGAGDTRDTDWPTPIDFMGDTDLTGAPDLRREHLPEAIADFVFDNAARMGVDRAAMALAAIVSLASVASDTWALQPKRFDTSWTENPRLWGAIIGPPSILKTPVLRVATRPIDQKDAKARERHAGAMREWKADIEKLKEAKAPKPWPPAPRCDRYLAESATVEALSELMRDDDEARFNLPAGKVLVRQDELSEWVAGMDQYKAGGRGGADRGAFLRMFNGGRFTVDRIGRGSFAIPNWSGCVLGGIQPEPIQRIARDAADDGLLQRFLFVVPAGQGDGEDRAPDTAGAKRYADLFDFLTGIHPPRDEHGDVLHVRLSEGAHQHREAINDLVKAMVAMPDTSTRLQAALGKWPGIFARLALIYHLVDIADARRRGDAGPPMLMVPEEAARRAAALMRDVLLPHLLRADNLLFQTAQTGHARWIAGYILANAEAQTSGFVTLRDIQRAYPTLRAPEHRRTLTDVLTSLEVVGWLRAAWPDNPARPVTKWLVNPALFTIFASRATEERERRDAARAATTAAARAFRK